MKPVDLEVSLGQVPGRCVLPPTSSSGQEDAKQRLQGTPTTPRPGMTSLGAPGPPQRPDPRSRSLGNWGICSRYFRLSACFRNLKESNGPSAVAGFSLVAEGLDARPRPRPIESGPCGWGPDRGISLMMPTCSQAGSCHPGASMSLAAAPTSEAPYSGCPVHLCRGGHGAGW